MTFTHWTNLPRLAIAFALLVLIGYAAPIAHVAAASACQTSPSDANCNGRNPQTTGCEADAYTLSTAEAFGTVRAAVRYSPTCRSAWTRVVNLSNLSGSRVIGNVLRSDGTSAASAFTYPTTSGVSSMVYLPTGATVKAIGTLQNSAGTVISQVQTGYVRP
jgi:hypothetical protein